MNTYIVIYLDFTKTPKKNAAKMTLYIWHIPLGKSWRIMANQGSLCKQNDQIKRQRLTSTELCFVVFACETLLDMHYMVTTNPMYLSAAQLLDNTSDYVLELLNNLWWIVLHLWALHISKKCYLHFVIRFRLYLQCPWITPIMYMR